RGRKAEARSLGGINGDGLASAQRRTCRRGAAERGGYGPSALSALWDTARTEPGVLPRVRPPASRRSERPRPAAGPGLATATRLVSRRLGLAVAAGAADRGARRHRRGRVRFTRPEARRLRHWDESLRAAAPRHDRAAPASHGRAHGPNANGHATDAAEADPRAVAGLEGLARGKERLDGRARVSADRERSPVRACASAGGRAQRPSGGRDHRLLAVREPVPRLLRALQRRLH